MLTVRELKTYTGCSPHALIEYVKEGKLVSTEVDLTGLTYEERIEVLDCQRNLNQWLTFQEEGQIEYIEAERHLSRSKCHIYLGDFKVRQSTEWKNINNRFNESVKKLSVKANKRTPLKVVGQAIFDWLLVCFFLWLLVQFGVSEQVLSNPVDAIFKYMTTKFSVG